MFKILPFTTKTARAISSTVWKTNRLHTSSIFYSEKPPKANLKTKKVKADKEKETPALCAISEGEDHETIKKGLDNEELVDILVSHILDMDIKVYKVALEYNVTVFKGNLGNISKGKYPKNLPKEIKVARYSVAEDEVITLNWNKLIDELNLNDHKEILVKELFENISNEKDLGLKRNVLGYFLSQGLSNVRPATDVYQRARTILCATKGDFTKEEDKIILEGRKEEKSWSVLVKQLGRSSHSSVQHRYEVLIGDFEYKHGPFTVEEDKLILREVFAVNKNILLDRNITMKNWKNIGEKLQRKSKTVLQRWATKIEPLLKRYHVGTLNDDVREVLINHLVTNNLNYTQEVDWKELARLPKFAGTTPTFLNKMYADLRLQAGRKYPELNEVKLDTGAIQMYLDNRETVYATSQAILEHQETIITFYLAYVLEK